MERTYTARYPIDIRMLYKIGCRRPFSCNTREPSHLLATSKVVDNSRTCSTREIATGPERCDLPRGVWVSDGCWVVPKSGGAHGSTNSHARSGESSGISNTKELFSPSTTASRTRDCSRGAKSDGRVDIQADHPDAK